MKVRVVLAAILLALAAAGCAAGPSAEPTRLVETPTPQPRTPAQLKAMLAGDDDNARLEAIDELARDGSPEAVVILGEFFRDVNGIGRLEAASALLHINTDASHEYIRQAMAEEQLSARRQVAMQALEANIDVTYPFLQALLRDSDETVRLNTVQVVQFLGSAEARTLLQSALNDSSPQVQAAAAEALQALGDSPTPTQ